MCVHNSTKQQSLSIVHGEGHIQLIDETILQLASSSSITSFTISSHSRHIPYKKESVECQHRYVMKVWFIIDKKWNNNNNYT